MMGRGIIFILTLSLGFIARAQDRCATPAQLPEIEQEFEDWMQAKQFEKSLERRVEQRQAEVYILPVVVHIIHNGEAVGVGGNLSDAKIQEQIDILNEDFRKLNPRSGTVPSEFLSVEADIEVEFVLARQDSLGDPTNGIVRKQGSQSSYTYPGDNLKEESYWPAEDYFNIWISQVNFLGWASFPETTLPGSISPETNRLYDGVVIDADWWGYNGNTGGSFDSYGQTVSHEIGHFLGLRHIWGDGNCSASDYCDDTPPAAGDYGGLGSPCTFPAVESEETPFADGNSCSSDNPDLPDMFMNFMDYTNDECMSLFTLDQKFRMRTVLENSPRRLSLRTSLGLEAPILLDLDLAMDGVTGVPLISCNTQISPIIGMRNFGFDEITSFKLTYTVDGNPTIVSESGISITSGGSYFLPIEVSGLIPGANEISWEITEVNGASDEDATNNIVSSSLEVQTETFEAPFKQDFSTDGWNTASTQVSEWSTISLKSNASAAVGAFDNDTNVESWLVSPVFDLSNFEEAAIFFRMSYGIRFGFSDDLEVKISTSCDDNFQTIWSAELGDLGFPSTSTAWTPTEDDDWLDRFIALDDFVGFSELRLAFVFTNNGGNNFYLDDIELTNNSDPDQPRLFTGKFVAYPNPAKQSFNVTLSLPEIQRIRLQLIDMSGAVVTDLTYDNMLNQTFTIDTPKKYGMYFLRISGKGINQTQRMLISR